jgi:uncharacterized spore protein YtfJ
MGEKNNLFENTVDSLMNGMNGMLSTKTVVGEAIHIGDTIILPLVDVSFGVGAGMFHNGTKAQENAGGGLGGKMSPSAVLVIQNGTTKMVSVKEQDGLMKLIDMIPDFVNKFTKKHNKEDEYAREEAAQEMEEMLSASAQAVEETE